MPKTPAPGIPKTPETPGTPGKTAEPRAAARKTPRLGRGLSTLIGPAVPITPAPPTLEPTPPPIAPQPTPALAPPQKLQPTRSTDQTTSLAKSATGAQHALAPAQPGLVYLPVRAIQRNPYQPRQSFDEQSLRRLAQSIRTEGVLQPILVRPLPAPTAQIGRGAATSSTPATYELVAGERRLRAAQIAGLTEIPALVRQLDERQTAELALIENLQREDLNPIERAQAFEKLTNQFGLSHEQIAHCVGIDRATVTNLLRLLSLSQVIQDLVRKGVLSAGQARALAGVMDVQQQQVLAERAVARGWSVRQLEQEVRRLTSPAGGAGDGAPWIDKRKLKAASVRDLEEQIGKHLHTKVRIKPKRKKGSGTLEIEFYSIDQFESLLTQLGVRMD